VATRHEDGLTVADRPAGEGARRLGNILLAIRADAAGKQLHQLAGKVLVRVANPALREVEVEHHRRVAGDSAHQLAEVAQPLADEEHRLVEHKAGPVDLGVAGSEVAVPEERHLLLERLGGVEHPEEPDRPVAVHRQQVEPLVERAVIEPWILDGGYQALDGVVVAQPRPLVQFGGGGAKPGSPQQMRRAPARRITCHVVLPLHPPWPRFPPAPNGDHPCLTTVARPR